MSGWILTGDVSFTASGWILTLNTKTRDVFFTTSGWILTLWPMILYVVSDYDGYYQVPQVMTKDLLLLASRPWRVLPIPRIVTIASSLSFPQQWWELPCKYNILFLCVLDTRLRSGPNSCTTIHYVVISCDIIHCVVTHCFASYVS
jgi:hypothetical protein